MGIILTALGNRAWGDDINPKWVGVLLMALGLCYGQPIYLLPAFLAVVYIFRAPSSGSWLSMHASTNWVPAIVRGLYVIPLVALNVYLHGYLHLLGLIAIPAFAAIYWLAGKQTKFNATLVAELAAGALLGVL